MRTMSSILDTFTKAPPPETLPENTPPKNPQKFSFCMIISPCRTSGGLLLGDVTLEAYLSFDTGVENAP